MYAFHRYSDRLDKTAFVGVHTGHLGFYADWVPHEIEKLVLAIAKTPYHTVEYPLLEVIVTYHENEREERYLALNECTIKSIEGSLVADVEIKGQLFETFRATASACQLHQAAQPTIRRWAERLSIRLSGRSSLRKWLQLITACSVRSGHLCFSHPIMIA